MSFVFSVGDLAQHLDMVFSFTLVVIVICSTIMIYDSARDQKSHFTWENLGEKKKKNSTPYVFCHLQSFYSLEYHLLQAMRK